jgi:hypothetical protein
MTGSLFDVILFARPGGAIGVVGFTFTVEYIVWLVMNIMANWNPTMNSVMENNSKKMGSVVSTPVLVYALYMIIHMSINNIDDTSEFTTIAGIRLVHFILSILLMLMWAHRRTMVRVETVPDVIVQK